MKISLLQSPPRLLVVGICLFIGCTADRAMAQVPPLELTSSGQTRFQVSDEPLQRSGRSLLSDSESAIAPEDHLEANSVSESHTIGAMIDEAIANAISPESRLDVFFVQSEPYEAYRRHRTAVDWIAGSNEDLGWLSWQSDPYLHKNSSTGLLMAFNLHWLSGPVTPDVSPRLYDAVLGYQHRQSFSHTFSYDVAASVGVFSDFAGSARQGVRFPAHAVGIIHMNYRTDFVFGVDYLDRGDIKILPVVGLSIREFLVPNVRLDLVFPRPRIDFALDSHHRIYVAGLLGGGTWDYQASQNTRDLLTYRDYRVIFGFETADISGHLSAIELGYAFSRQLEFASTGTADSFTDAFVLQWVSRY